MRRAILVLMVLSGLAHGQAWMQDPPMCLQTEADPQVGTLTASQWCTANAGGTAVDCTTAAPVLTESDPIATHRDVAETITQGWCWESAGVQKYCIYPAYAKKFNLVTNDTVTWDEYTAGKYYASTGKTTQLHWPDLAPSASTTAYIPAENGTLLTENSTTAWPHFLALTLDNGLSTGVDATTPTANTAGYIDLISAGDNAFRTDIVAGTQTQDISYTLPLDDGDASEFLQTNGSGVLSWQAALTAEADTLGTVVARGNSTVSSITTGGLSADGGTSAWYGYLGNPATNSAGYLQLYAWNGATGYLSVLQPSAAMTSSAIFSLPPDEPPATRILNMDSSGNIGYDASAYLTAEVDGVIGNEVANTTDSTLTRSGSGTGVSPYTLGLNLANANTWTAGQSVDTGSNGAGAPATWATMVTGAALVNDTASTAGVTVQDSPAIRFEGHAWDTDTGPQDDKWQWKIYTDQTSGTTTTSSMTFSAMKSPAGVDAAPSEAMSISNGGTLTAASTIIAGSGYIQAGSGFPMMYRGRVADGATAVGHKVAQVTTLTNPSAKLMSWYTDQATTEKAYIAVDGTINSSMAFSVPMTADAALYPGMIVKTLGASADDRFLANDDDLPIGILMGTGVTVAGTAYQVAIGGKAYIAPTEDEVAVARGEICWSDTNGYGLWADTVAAANHNREVGHALYTEAANVIVSLNDGTDTFTMTSDPAWVVGDPLVYWDSGDTTVTGLADGQVVWVQSESTTSITVALTKGGAKAALSGGTFAAGAYLMRLPLSMVHWN